MPVLHESCLCGGVKYEIMGLGTLDSCPGLRPERHVVVTNKAPRFEITDALPQHQGWPLE